MLGVALGVAACGRAPSISAQDGDLIVAHVTVLPMSRPGALADQTVVIRDDRIVAIAPSETVRVSAGATVIQGGGRWLMPGLADMHVHLRSERDLTLYLAAGVTTVRNMFGAPEHLAWRTEIEQGRRVGPTVLTAGPIIDGEPPVWSGSTVLTAPAQADAVVTTQQAQGYDFLKVYARLSRASYEALAAAAARHGMALAGHVPTAVGLRGVLSARQRTIEHLDGWLLALAPGAPALPETAGMTDRDRAALARLDPRGLPALIRETIAAGTWNCPTLVVLDRMAQREAPALRWLDRVAPEVRMEWDAARAIPRSAADLATTEDANAWKRRILAALAAAQAPILVGTDTGNPFVIPGEALHEELELLVAAGLPRERVLRAATADVGTFLGRPHDVGTLEVGARADLILVATDPRTSALPLVPDGVIARGAWHPRSELEARLASLVAPPAVRADRWAGVPPLAVLDVEAARASYDLSLKQTPVGGERLAFSRSGVVAQIVAALFGRIVVDYTLRPRDAAIAVTAPFGTTTVLAKVAGDHLEVTTTARDRRPDVRSVAMPPGAILTVPGAGGLTMLASKLAGMRSGERRQVTALEINYLPATVILPRVYDVERLADESGRHVFALTTAFRGRPAITEQLTVDDDGLVVAATLARPPGLELQRIDEASTPPTPGPARP